MGHDIFGYRTTGKEDREEIAYLRRSAGNPLARSIYRALGAEDEDCGCSGCGGEKRFSRTELEAALASISSDEEHEPERKFLRDCIAHGDDGVLVSFF